MKLKLTNWKNLSGEYEIGPQTLLTGPNGTGKTAILDAIQFALLGCIPRLGNSAATAQAYMSANKAEVALETDKGAIIRSLKVTKDDKFKSAVKFGKYTGPAASAMIEENLNPQAWLLDLRVFQAMSPGEQRKMLIASLAPGWDRLSTFESELVKKYSKDKDLNAATAEALEAVKEELKTLKAKKIDYESQVKALQERTLPVAAIDTDIAKTNEKLIKAKVALENLAGGYKQGKTEHDRWEKKIEKVKVKITNWETGIKDLQAQVSELSDTSNAKPPGVEPKAHANYEEIEQFSRDLGALQRKGSIIAHAIHPPVTCPIDKQKCPRDFKDSPLQQQLADLRHDYVKLNKKLKRSKMDFDEYKKAKKRWDRTNRDWQEAQKAALERKNLEDKIRAIQDQVSDATRNLAEYQAELAKHPMPKAGQDNPEIDVLQRQVDGLLTRLDELRGQKTQADALIEIGKLAERARITYQMADDHKRELQDLQRKLVLDTFGDVATKVGEILAVFGWAGELVIQEGKRNSLDIVWQNDTGEVVDITALSQGQLVLFWLAFASAVMTDNPGLKVLTLEAAELDDANLARLQEAVTAEKLGIDHLVVATWIPGGTGKDWTVITMEADHED